MTQLAEASEPRALGRELVLKDDGAWLWRNTPWCGAGAPLREARPEGPGGAEGGAACRSRGAGGCCGGKVMREPVTFGCRVHQRQRGGCSFGPCEHARSSLVCLTEGEILE